MSMLYSVILGGVLGNLLYYSIEGYSSALYNSIILSIYLILGYIGDRLLKRN